MLQLPDELLEIIISQCLFDEARPKLGFGVYELPANHQPRTLERIKLLSKVNQRFLKVIQRTFIYRDLKLLHHAAGGSQYHYQFYQDYCVLFANAFVPEQMFHLMQSLSTQHPVLFVVESFWKYHELAPSIEDFKTHVSESKKRLAVIGFEINMLYYIHQPLIDHREMAHRRQMMGGLFKLLQKTSCALKTKFSISQKCYDVALLNHEQYQSESDDED